MEIRRTAVCSFIGLQIICAFAAATEISIQWGMSARQGDRPSMEDAHNHEVWSPKIGLFGIYDGHGGQAAAHICEKEIPALVQRGSYESHKAARESLEKAFLDVDASINQKTESGSCGLVGLIDEDALHIAWAGDSRALVIRDNKIIFSTVDHKPDAPKEKVRIEAMGAYVEHYGVARVAGLAISRSLGDRLIKKNSYGSIIALPEVISIDIQPDDVLIMACDGIWDVLSNEEVAALIKRGLAFTGQELQRILPSGTFTRRCVADNCCENGNCLQLELIARFIRDTAYNKGSTDNLSVQIIRL